MSSLRKEQRGSILVLGLLTSITLLVVGFGLAGLQVSRKRVGESAILNSQARALAWAGFEDARIKLELDIDFPPGQPETHPEFIFSEELPSGTYRVRVSNEFNRPPYHLVRVWSTGAVGDSEEPTARVHLYAEFDTAVANRRQGFGVNPHYFRPIVIQEVTQ